MQKTTHSTLVTKSADKTVAEIESDNGDKKQMTLTTAVATSGKTAKFAGFLDDPARSKMIHAMAALLAIERGNPRWSMFLVKILNILNRAVYIQVVAPCVGDPPETMDFCYTVGLQWHHNHPDFILVGMGEKGPEIANSIIAGIKKGLVDFRDVAVTKFENEKVLSVPMQVRCVPDDSRLEYVGMANTLSQLVDQPLPKYRQLVWPKRDGSFVTHTSYVKGETQRLLL